MDTMPGPPRVVKFGVFEADLQSGELRKAGMKQRLAGQPFRVLQVLLEHPQEIVTREQLQQRLWPNNTFVDYELALKKAVNRLREVLGDSADSPHFIETVPRRGYRFIGAIGPMDEQSDATPAEPLPPPKLKARISIALIGGLSLAFFGAILLVLNAGKLRTRIFERSRPEINSLAVLPLQNLSNDPTQEYFSDGMTDALITNLAQIGSMKVISRTSSMQYKQTRKSLPEIAHELNVDAIVEGTVQRSGDRVRITAQLIHGSSDKHLWANSYERDMRDVLSLEREVTGDIAHQVQARLITAKQAPRAQSGLVDRRVLDAYLQGNYHLQGRGRGGGDEEEKEAERYFQTAINLDPNFAPAYIGLAQAYGSSSRGEPEDLAIIRRTAEKAVELDPFSSDAVLALGIAKEGAWDWHGAEEDYRRALALNPSHAAAHDSLGGVLDELRLGAHGPSKSQGSPKRSVGSSSKADDCPIFRRR